MPNETISASALKRIPLNLDTISNDFSTLYIIMKPYVLLSLIKHNLFENLDK